MDRFNLLWLLRYRFAYNLSAAETYYLLVPTAYQLNRTSLQQLVEFNSLPEVLEHLPESLSNLLLEVEDTLTEYDLLERIYHRIGLAKTFAECGQIQGNMDYIYFMLIGFEKSIIGTTI